MKWILLPVVLVSLAAGLLWWLRADVVRAAREEADERWHWTSIRAAADTTGLDPLFLAATVYVESRFDERAVSPAGAVGLMQLMPATAREVGKAHGIRITDTEQIFAPDTNILLGALYLSALIERFGDTRIAIMAYNGGPGAVGRWLEASSGEDTSTESFDKAETRRYVVLIEESYARLKRAWRFWDLFRDRF